LPGRHRGLAYNRRHPRHHLFEMEPTK